MPTTQDDPGSRCPLCQQANGCCGISGSAKCWCSNQPRLTQDRVTALLPPGTPAHCLCPACHAALLEKSHVEPVGDDA